MNTLFGDMAANLATFDPQTEAINAARPHHEEIIRLNFEDQLYERGVDSDGVKLRPYHPTTIEKKLYYREQGGRGKGHPYERDNSGERFRDTRIDHMTLKDTGFFQRSAKVKFSDKRFEITADDKKYSDDGRSSTTLRDEHGEEILGLTDKNMEFLKEKYILPTLRQTLRHKLSSNKNTF